MLVEFDEPAQPARPALAALRFSLLFPAPPLPLPRLLLLLLPATRKCRCHNVTQPQNTRPAHFASARVAFSPRPPTPLLPLPHGGTPEDDKTGVVWVDL